MYFGPKKVRKAKAGRTSQKKTHRRCPVNLGPQPKLRILKIVVLRARRRLLHPQPPSSLIWGSEATKNIYSFVDAYIASIAIRIMSDTRHEEQEQRWRERQDRGVLQDTQDLTITYIIPVIYLIV